MFNKALKHYKSGRFHFEKIRYEYRKVLESMNLTKSDEFSVIDIGSGSGRLLHECLIPLLPKNTKEIVVTDVDQSMVEFARSINEHPKVSFYVLDIGSENIPVHFHNRFDILFSSYCLQYLRDLRRGFTNCGKLLKSNGELSLIFQFKTNYLFSTYQKMSSIDKWKAHTEEYSKFTPHFSGPDLDSELKGLCECSGLTLLDYKFEPELHYEFPKWAIIGILQSIDSILAAIPKDRQEVYSQHFVRSLSELTNIDFLDEKTMDEIIKLPVPTVCIHARKKLK